MTLSIRAPRRAVSAAASVMALALVLTACSDDAEDEGATGADETTDATSGDLEVTEVHVGALTFADVAPLYVGIEQGFFEEEGLTVTINETAGGAAQVPALISGDVAFTYASYVAVFQAATQGIPLQVVRDNNRHTPQGIHVPGESSIQSVEDLQGATIAINSFASIMELSSRAVLDSHGVDPSTVEFVELAPSEHLAALDRGDIDAAFMVEPFMTMAANDGYREVMPAWQGPTENFPIAGWIATRDFATDNPNTVEAFNRGMDRAIELIHDEPQVLADVIPTYTQIPEDLVPQVAEAIGPMMIEHSRVEGLQQVVDLMAEWDLLTEEIDPDDYIFQGAR